MHNLKNENMKKGHHFSFLALLIGMLALSAAVAGKIFAESWSSVYVCSYSTGEWSTCVNGFQTRTVTPTPSGCYPDPNLNNIPKATQTCTSGSTVTPCGYTYSDWSTCNSYGKQTRTIIARIPTGCTQTIAPILEQTCVPANSVSPCTYSYGEWGLCVSGFQSRSLLSKTPSGCSETTAPLLNRVCTVDSAVQTAVACSYTYSSWGICTSDGKQTRTVTAKTPSGCVDSAVPILQQTCTPNTTTNSSSYPATVQAPQEIQTTNPGITPVVELNIGDGMVVTDVFTIEARVSGASVLEWYSMQTDSNIAKYLGLATKNTEGAWKFTLDPKKFPNGTYQLRLRVKNIYGSYEGAKRTIVIINAPQELLPVTGTAVTTPNATTNIAPAQEENFNGDTTVEWQVKYFGNPICVREAICGSGADVDKDGLNNAEEFRLGSDPKNPDSDLDGFIDGDEIKGGFDPLKSSPGDRSDKIVFENPKESGEIKKDLFKVDSVELIKNEESAKIKFSGKAIPNAFVTIYIYSDPIILTVRTDNEGNWSYELDKDLEDGDHQAYVAVTDNTGKITAKSEPIAFVKTAQAVSVIPPVEAANAQEASPTTVWYKNSILFFIAIALGAVALALAIIGMVLHKKAQMQD